jgi:ABC-type branched-subunit amino acid transport system ATPase component
MTAPTTPAGLAARNLTVRFGGLVAVSDVDFDAPPGEITGLIGPNGAGKTTTFNACAGAVAATGAVRLGDTAIDRWSAARRAQAGLGRTFQRFALFDTMTVVENVAMGPETHTAGRRPWHQLVASPAERRRTADAARAAMERCGIAELADRRVAELSTGQRRLVELARAIATPFRFLLLDEPSSGLDVAETHRFGDILLDYVAETGIGLLLVEHDMALVRRVCSSIFVLDFGKLIYRGSTQEVLASDVVRAAYLGTEEVA